MISLSDFLWWLIATTLNAFPILHLILYGFNTDYCCFCAFFDKIKKVFFTLFLQYVKLNHTWSNREQKGSES